MRCFELELTDVWLKVFVVEVIISLQRLSFSYFMPENVQIVNSDETFISCSKLISLEKSFETWIVMRWVDWVETNEPENDKFYYKFEKSSCKRIIQISTKIIGYSKFLEVENGFRIWIRKITSSKTKKSSNKRGYVPFLCTVFGKLWYDNLLK